MGRRGGVGMNGHLFSGRQAEMMKRFGKRSSIILLVIVALIVLAIISFNIVTEYIWMGTLDFEKVYTTILYSKISLAVAGFILFFILTFITLYFIRRSFMKQFSEVQLPNFIKERRQAFSLMAVASI